MPYKGGDPAVQGWGGSRGVGWYPPVGVGRPMHYNDTSGLVFPSSWAVITIVGNLTRSTAR